MKIQVSANIVSTNKGRGIEIVIGGLREEEIASVAEQIRQVLQENTKRIFGDTVTLYS
jgi:hypothetical protein